MLSTHLKARCKSRNIDVDQFLGTIEEATVIAAKKGSKKLLVVIDELAFIVSVKSNHLVTVIRVSETKEGCFTNIDTAIIRPLTPETLHPAST